MSKNNRDIKQNMGVTIIENKNNFLTSQEYRFVKNQNFVTSLVFKASYTFTLNLA
jgi:hypothetical protein